MCFCNQIMAFTLCSEGSTLSAQQVLSASLTAACLQPTELAQKGGSLPRAH